VQRHLVAKEENKMATFRVHYDYTVTETDWVDVEAEDGDEAEDRAYDEVGGGIEIFDVEEI